MAGIKTFFFNLFRENTMVASADGRNCVIIDPGFCEDDEKEALFGYIDGKGLKPVAVLLTHGHPDHIFGVAETCATYGCPVYMHPDDSPTVDFSCKYTGRIGVNAPDISFSYEPVSDGFTLDAAGFSFEVIHTPGHTPGCVCWLDRKEKILFSGDTLFAGTIGRTDLEGGDYDKEIVSIMEKLMILDGDIRVFPGHGPSTTIADERTGNPMLEPFNEPEEKDDGDVEPVVIHNV